MTLCKYLHADTIIEKFVVLHFVSKNTKIPDIK